MSMAPGCRYSSTVNVALTTSHYQSASTPTLLSATQKRYTTGNTVWWYSGHLKASICMIVIDLKADECFVINSKCGNLRNSAKSDIWPIEW